MYNPQQQQQRKQDVQGFIISSFKFEIIDDDYDDDNDDQIIINRFMFSAFCNYNYRF